MLVNRLKNLRRGRGISQRQLAEAIGVSQQTIGSWEVSRTEPSHEFLTKIADYFGVSTSYFLEESSTPPAIKLPPPLSVDESKLLKNYRHLNAQGKKAIWSMFKALGVASAEHSHAVSN